MEPKPFQWPEGKRAALSLTFDDARPSQLDLGLPVLDAHGVKATFYVSPANMARRLDDWRAAAANGHEMGNHTLHHPCSANFSFARGRGLEDYTIEQMEADILGGSEAIERMLGVTATTFAYPCGQKFVGRGEGVVSYVPLVARHFVVGRGAFNESHNDPRFCDLAQLFGMDMDDEPFARLKAIMDHAIEDDGGWLVLFGHDVGSQGGRQLTRADALDALCQYAIDPANGIWIDTVDAVGRYVEETQG
ncbi:polysaccharide deacetylase family protein [Planctomycetota bacterium]